MIVIVNIFRSLICKLRKSKTRVQALYDVIVIGFHSRAHNNAERAINFSCACVPRACVTLIRWIKVTRALGTRLLRESSELSLRMCEVT